jgi:hypothetical protein
MELVPTNTEHYGIWEALSAMIWFIKYLSITYYWTVPLILDHSYLVGNFTNSIIA